LPPDMPVLAEWEGCKGFVNTFEIEEYQGERTLIFDVGEY
jgi:hypothetical protein